MPLKRRVLLVDGEPSFTRLLKLNLEKTGGYIVKEVNAGSQALPAALEFRPDVILLDVILPDIDGGTVLSQLRASEAARRAKVIFLTAVLSKAEAESKGQQLRAVPCIAKPAGVDELIQSINSLFGEKTAAA